MWKKAALCAVVPFHRFLVLFSVSDLLTSELIPAGIVANLQVGIKSIRLGKVNRFQVKKENLCQKLLMQYEFFGGSKFF